MYQQVPSQQLEVDNGDGSGYKVRFRGFEEWVLVQRPLTTAAPFGTFKRKKAKRWPILRTADGYVSSYMSGTAEFQERYVCIEPGYVREFKSLKPGEEFIGQQIISVV